MSVYTNPPEWEAQGKKPPSSKRTEGWKPGDRVPASWLNWFWFSTVNSLREIAQAFVNHRDASAPHDGHETKTGATQKVQAHSDSTTGVHGVGAGYYVAKTSRSDQWPSWNDIPDKPSTFPADAATLPQASTSQAGIVQLTNSRSSASETLAVTAKALNDHRNSADHDGRYYTKNEIDARIGAGVLLMIPSDDVLAESLAEQLIQEDSGRVKIFRVWAMGRYRLSLEARGLLSDRTQYLILNVLREKDGITQRVNEVIVPASENFAPFSMTTPVLFPEDQVYFSLRSSGGPTSYAAARIRNVRLCGRLEAAPSPEALN